MSEISLVVLATCHLFYFFYFVYASEKGLCDWFGIGYMLCVPTKL